jgi:hypothetical protein
MSVTQKLVTTNFNVESAASFVGSFANNDYFVFAGKHTPYPGSDAVITTPNNSVKSTNLDVYDNMIFAKRISSGDVVHVADKHLWSSNTFYDKYDHRDGDLHAKRFYTVVDEGTEYNVYKCLFNNSNTTVNVNSTVAPSGKILDPFPTGDQYIWKYMYSITKTQYEKFATTNYMPVIANTTVAAGAVPGTIEVIDIVTRGRGYDNYISNGVFRTTDLSVGGVNTIYGAPDTAEAEDDYYRGCVIKITSSSAGAAGQYRRIVDYRGVGGQKIFILNAPFTIVPAAGDEYEVYPYVYVWGDGTETTAAEGRAIIDSAANSIVEIEMLSVGAGYRYGESYAGKTADTVPITINSAFIDLPASIANNAGFLAATLQPIVSPPGGHGSDPLTELGARRVCISTKFTNSEGGTIPVENDFRQVGILKNPLYTNVDMILKAANTVGGNFNIGETVYQFKQYKLLGNVSIITSNTTIKKTDQGRISSVVTITNGGTAYDSAADTIFINNSGTGGAGFAATFANNGSGVITSVTVTNQGNNYITLPTLTVNTATGSNGQLAITLANPQVPTFKDNFVTGDYVLVTKGSNNFLSTVSGVPQDYQITVSTNATFTADDCEISALVLQASGRVTSSNAGQITLSNVAGVFTEESKIIGLASGVTSIVETTAIAGQASLQVNDKAAGAFNTAVQLSRLVGNFPTGGTSFIADENVEQESLISFAKPRGSLHSINLGGGEDDDVMFISNKFGIYNLDEAGVRDIVGVTSGATLENLSNKYPGDFVVGSGQVLYIENLDPITRAGNKSEIIKIILEF